MEDEKDEDLNFPDLNSAATKDKKESKKSKKSNKIPTFIKILLAVFVVICITVSLFSFKLASIGKNIFQSEENDSILTQIKHLILSEDKKIKGEDDGRTNILLLGMGGEGHEGALLTDTIIIASIKYNNDANPDVALISVPRDMAVPFGSSNYVKINSVYTYGKINNPDDENAGSKLITDYVNTISGLPIHYYAQVDFEGFEQIVDSIGGIEVDVKNSFYDSMYPTENFGYQTISFNKGINQMNGDLALKYARSRHGIVTDGNEGEGSDFARAKRQQQILASLKDKTFSVSTILNPKKINEILTALGNHVRTNLEPWEMLRLSEIAQDIENDKVVNKVIDQESGLLRATRGNSNAFLLMPNDKGYTEIKQVFSNIFNLDVIENQKEELRLAILNGTSINGLAGKSAIQLKKEGYTISYTGNASENDYEKTVIYDLSSGELPDALSILREKFNANLSSLAFNNKLIKNSVDISNVNFVLILGLDSGNDFMGNL